MLARGVYSDVAMLRSGRIGTPRFPRSALISMPQSFGIVAVLIVMPVLTPVWTNLYWDQPMGILALTTSRDLKAISFDP